MHQRLLERERTQERRGRRSFCLSKTPWVNRARHRRLGFLISRRFKRSAFLPSFSPNVDPPLFPTSRMSNVAGPSTPRTPSLSSEREEQPARPPPSRITRIAHKIIGYDSEAPDTVGSSDYLKELAGSPGEGVSGRCQRARASRAPLTRRPPLRLFQVKDYFRSLFPFVRWLPNYNGTWLISDLIA